MNVESRNNRISELARLRDDVTPPPDLVARVMTRVSEPRFPSLWQWLNRPFLIEIRISPIVIIGLALALGTAFVYVGATIRVAPSQTRRAQARTSTQRTNVRFWTASRKQVLIVRHSWPPASET